MSAALRPEWSPAPDSRRARVETAAAQEHGTRILATDIVRMEQLRARTAQSLLRPQPGSVLAFDDEATDYDPLSHHSHTLIAVAVDHMETLRELLPKNGGQGILPTLAGYTLLRPALEAAAWGLWLQTGGTVNKRVLRSLRLTWDHRANADRFTGAAGVANDAGRDHMASRLADLRDRRKVNRGKALDTIPTTSTVFAEIDRRFAQTQFTGLISWQIMSGIAHANRSAMSVLLEQRLVEADGDVGTYSMTSSLLVFATMVHLTLDYVDALIDLHVQRATTPLPHQWPVPHR